MPSVWDDVQGQERAISLLRGAVARNRLAHGYLFVGSEGVGKRLVAQHFAQCLFCQTYPDSELDACGACSGCRPFLAGAHPDFHVVECPEGKREIPVELFVGSRERRGQEGLCHSLSLQPLPGSRKVAIIDDADLMNDASSNAMLKTLEEPPGNGVLILIASSLDAVLPTIRSRTQLLRFEPLPEAVVTGLLQKLGWTESAATAAETAALSEGSLATAHQLLEPTLRDLRMVLVEKLAERNFSASQLTKSVMEGLEKTTKETSGQRDAAQHVLRFCLEFYRAAMWTASGEVNARAGLPEGRRWGERFAGSLEAAERVSLLLDRVLAASGQIDQNASLPLCFESLFDDLSRQSLWAGAR